MSRECWIDGKCKTCGCLVIESASEREYDYENTCTNPKCEHFGWHDIGDQEELNYYEHHSKIVIENSEN